MEDIIIRPQNLAVETWRQEQERTLAAAAEIMQVVTDEEFDRAGQLINAFAHLTKELEVERKKLTAPLDALKKQIMVQEKDLAFKLSVEQDRLREMANAYATRRLAEREAADRAAREAAAAAAEQAEMQERAQEAFGAAPVQSAPAAIAVPDKLKSTAVKQVTVFTFQITDAAKLDRKFLSPDEGKIRAFCQYLKNMGIDPATVNEPGLVIKKEVRIDSK